MKINQEFLMSHKLSIAPRLFRYLGQDLEYFDDCCNHMVQEVSTGIINHIELEWFNQRTIKEVTMQRQYTHRIKAYYSVIGKGDYRLKPIDRSKSTVVLAPFLGNNVKTEGNYVTFESNDAWGKSIVSKFHKDNVVSIEEIKEALQ